MLTRTLGRSGIEVAAIGMGCWAIGGPFTRRGEPVGWGNVDDDESIRAIERALDHGPLSDDQMKRIAAVLRKGA